MNSSDSTTIVNTVLRKPAFHSFQLLVLYKWHFCLDTISVYEIKNHIMYIIFVLFLKIYLQMQINIVYFVVFFH